MKSTCLLAGAALVFGAPAAAQDHSGMSMPMGMHMPKATPSKQPAKKAITRRSTRHPAKLAAKKLVRTKRAAAPVARARAPATMPAMNHSKMPGMDHSAMPGMDHSTMPANGQAAARAMDQSAMPAMNHRATPAAGTSAMSHSSPAGGQTPMPAVDHSAMPGIDHQTTAAADHAAMTGMGHSATNAMDPNMPGMAHSAMSHAAGEGSGTSRLPQAEGAMPGIHFDIGKGWMGMAHGYAWGVYTDQTGPRGDKGLYVQSMAMLMAEKPFDWGKVQLRSMLSAEPLMGPRGYPNLFATGETANGVPLVDRQHPHDLFMELSARVDVNLSPNTTAFLYGGP